MGLNKTLIIVEVTIDPENPVIPEQMDSEIGFINELIKKVETPTETAFSRQPWNHLEELGYQVTARILPRDIAKVLDLHFIDNEDEQ